MKYELAKRLKDAGFPQTGRGELCISPDPKPVREIETLEDRSRFIAYIPTLSELIFECGNRFHSLCQELGLYDTGFYALAIGDGFGGLPLIRTKGETPEEAVANQFLALNANNQTEKSS